MWKLRPPFPVAEVNLDVSLPPCPSPVMNSLCQAGANLSEGMKAILASGVFGSAGGGKCAVGDGRTQEKAPVIIESGQGASEATATVVSYFNARTGTWETIRGKSDW